MKRLGILALWLLAGCFLICPARGNDELIGLLKLIDHDEQTRARVDSLSVGDVEWFLYEADIEEAFTWSGGRIFWLISKGIDLNRTKIDEEKLARYMTRVVEMARLSEGTRVFEEVAPRLKHKFDHPIISRYWDSVERRGGVKALTGKRPIPESSPFAGDKEPEEEKRDRFASEEAAVERNER